MVKKSVAIVVKNLSAGGAERSAANLSIMLDDLGFDVHIILLEDKVVFNYKGTCQVLKTQNSMSKWRQFLRFKKYIADGSFDFIIDFRGRTSTFRELLIYRYIYKKSEKVIFTIHESKIKNYIPEPLFLFRNFLNKTFKIISVSKAIESLLKTNYGFNNTNTIFNAVNISEIKEQQKETVEIEGEYVLAIGRLIKLKQFDELIDAYSRSILPKRNIKLVIIGDGELKDELVLKIKNNELKGFVEILPFQNNPYKYISKAKYLVLCSKREGFPYVLIESLACNTPVIAFDCVSGPREIIKDEHNGLLIKDQDFSELIKGMDRFITDNNLYQHCKSNSKKSVEKFSVESISKDWGKLLK